MSNNIPIVNLGLKYANGCVMTYATASTLTISTGQVRDSTNVFDIPVTSTLTLNTALSGANGLDTGTVANNTTYGVFVLLDPSNTNPPACLMSTSFTAPIMPSVQQTPYGAFRLVGFVRTNGSAQILPFLMNGIDNSRYIQYVTPIAVSTAGNDTSYTAIALTSAVPNDSTVKRVGRVKFQAAFTPGAASRLLKVKPTAGAADVIVITGQVASVVLNNVFDLLPASNSVDYLVSNSGDAETLQVLGYELSL